MSRDGLSTANFLGGAMQGYQFMAGVEDDKQRREERKQSAGLRDADEARRAESHDANMKLNEQNSKINDSRIKEQQEAELFKTNALIARKARSMEQAGVDWTPESEKAFNLLNPRARPDFIQSEPVRQSRQIYKDAMQGKIEMNDQRAHRAFETLFPEVITGATDGRKVKVNKLVPAEDGSGVYVGLEVTNPDGSVNPNGGLTVGRSADPKAKMRLETYDDLNQVVGTMDQTDAAWSNPKMREAYLNYYAPMESLSAKDQSSIAYNNSRANYYNSKAQNEKSGGAGGGGKLPGKAQLHEYLKVEFPNASKEDLWTLANSSPDDPWEYIGNHIKMQAAAEELSGDRTPQEAKEKAALESLQRMRAQLRPDLSTAKKTEAEKGAAVVSQLMGGQKQAQQVQIPMRAPTPQKQAPDAAIQRLKADLASGDSSALQEFQDYYGYKPEGL